MSGAADWAYLPELVANLVLDKLFETIDRVRFGAVCSYWHLVAEEHRLVHQNHKKQLPMLMIPATNNHNKRRLYSISERKIYPIHLSVPNQILIGSCFNGWVAFGDHKTFAITLTNPFKNATTPIHLPPLKFDHIDLGGSKFKIKKVILSADPFVCPKNYVVIVIYGGWGCLALFRSGRKTWGKIDVDDFCLCTDIVFHKNILYAVTNYGRIGSLDLTSINDYDKPIKVNVLIEHGDIRIPRVYLVESTRGDLLMVQRSFVRDVVEQGGRKTNNIKVCKLVQDPTKRELIEMTSLDGDAVFVGFNYSCSVSSSEIPKCIRNSIYFTNDFFQLYNSMDGPCDLGVYNVEEKSFGEHYKLQKSDNYFYPAIWVFPPVES